MDVPVADVDSAVRADVLEAVFARVPLIVFALDADGTCLLSDGAGLEFVGLRPGEAVGRNMFEMYADRPEVSFAIRRAIDGESFRSEYDTPIQGRVFDTWWLPRQVGSDRCGAIGISVDVTEVVEARRVLEEDLARQQGMLLQLHEAQETERRRIAGDVHDDTIQVLAAVNLRMQGLRRTLVAGPVDGAELAGVVSHLDDTLRQAASRLRALLVALDPPTVRDVGLAALLKEQSESALQDCPTRFSFEISVAEDPSDLVGRTVLRIVQEALTNVRKHARATVVSVRVSESNGHYRVRVLDDGVGLGSTSAGARHLGLRSLSERAEAMGGWCTVGPGVEGGTLVEASVPARLQHPHTLVGGAGQWAFFEQTMEGITDSYCAIDRDWRYVYANSAAHRLQGRDLSEAIVGRSVWDDDVPPDLAAAYRSAAANHLPTTVTVHHDNVARWIQHRLEPAGTGLSVFARDVTERRRVTAEADAAGRRIDSGRRILGALTSEQGLAESLHEALTHLQADAHLVAATIRVTGDDGVCHVLAQVGEAEADAQSIRRVLPVYGTAGAEVELVGDADRVDPAIFGLLALRIAAGIHHGADAPDDRVVTD